MALRIDLAITHGELDNTERGRIRGRLWLLGREQPVELDLDGDAWRDVAGTRLTFKNPTPVPQSTSARLNTVQIGMAGDITASRKVKVFTVDEEEWQEAYRQDRIDEVPTEWRNSLYLEWFTPEQGRCVVESADFEITISEHVWEMDEDEEGAQKLANMQAMRDFLAGIIQRPEPREDTDSEDDTSLELSEEEWEEQLKASDRLTDASMEAYEKYGEDNDSEEKTAFVMGWDHLLEDMADAQEGVEPSENDSEDKKRRREWNELMDQAAAEAEEAESWQEDDEEDESHPLYEQAREYVVQVRREMRQTGLNEDHGEDPDHPLDRFMTNIMQISGKLAGALHSRRDLEDSNDRGYVLAITKRCLNWANEALAALQDMQATPAYAVHRPLFETWKTGVLNLREGINQLRDELKEE
ncbi:hypothetical protein EI77_01950 [Prosthecobacter fusiformis]|uniref:Uncharacterized protein n=1 Tax=Prosthecobacter fusiformis TaxID=48464 RepID=A0A4R7RY97_9BACT|nr:hypothetical protein [Prosthecobacter fusiformis]TDU70832.1 hypothetical protein EI77_01950 [Prosthecobacter fusiformis]